MLCLLLAASSFSLSSSSSVLDLVNGRFASGSSNSTSLSTAGVVIHQFDNWNDPSSQWMPCPTTMWCANFSDRWSTSLVNHESPTKDDGGLNLYNNLMPGFILAPTGNVLNCAFSQDGGTSLRICDAAGKAAGCIPGCYTEQGNHYPVPDGVPCWCDTGVTQCASGHGATGPSACAWKPDELSKMLTKQAHFNSYNELLFDTTAYAAALPGSLEAFFIMAESQQDQKNMTSEQHAHFLSTYGRTAQQTPLLVFDPTNLAKPFSCVTC